MTLNAEKGLIALVFLSAFNCTRFTLLKAFRDRSGQPPDDLESYGWWFGRTVDHRLPALHRTDKRQLSEAEELKRDDKPLPEDLKPSDGESGLGRQVCYYIFHS